MINTHTSPFDYKAKVLRFALIDLPLKIFSDDILHDFLFINVIYMYLMLKKKVNLSFKASNAILCNHLNLW